MTPRLFAVRGDLGAQVRKEDHLADRGHLRDEHDEAEAADDANAVNGAAPAIIAELTAEIATLSVSDAVMRLDLMDEPAYQKFVKANA